MTDDNYRVSVLGPTELAEKLNISIRSEELSNLEKDTPSNLKDIVHYALAWGIDDDGYRRDFIMKAPETMRRNLKFVVGAREDELDDWLAGPEARKDNFTAAYIAFSNMRMASDEILE